MTRSSHILHRNVRTPVALIVVIAWLIAAGLLIYNRQTVVDWWKLQFYNPSPAIAALAKDDTMTKSARQIFYVNEPQLENKDTFNNFCQGGDEQSVVLGCYRGDQDGIYLLKVSDPRLHGIEQVTAAHEMLHAAYDRLDSKTKQSVDAMLMDYYRHGLQDQTIKDIIAQYKKTEPDEVVNEMHSVFGTTITKLPAGLENYYKRYFSDRAKVVADYNSYESEFTSRQDAVAAYDTQLAGLKQQISDKEADLVTRKTELQAKQAQLNGYKNNGDAQAYNTGVPAYNSLVDQYNAEVSEVHQLVQQYNNLVEKRNALAFEEQQLVQDITSQASPIGQ